MGQDGGDAHPAEQGTGKKAVCLSQSLVLFSDGGYLSIFQDMDSTDSLHVAKRSLGNRI